jgi:hypothetical protein
MEFICRKIRVGDDLLASGHFGRATEGDDLTPLRQAGAMGLAVGRLLFFDDIVTSPDCDRPLVGI